MRFLSFLLCFFRLLDCACCTVLCCNALRCNAMACGGLRWTAMDCWLREKAATEANNGMQTQRAGSQSGTSAGCSNNNAAAATPRHQQQQQQQQQ
ncbi:hypothetical protein GQ42DRAFT_81502 [Ramicandelaber brevisporus]|nr:hypothetical protein GQ42DRAFT_81502 [Ramicandelaber brevisporus]